MSKVKTQLLLLLFSVLIPSAIIYYSFDTYVFRSAEAIESNVSLYIANKLDGVVSTIDWWLLIKRLVLVLFIYNILVKRWIDGYKDNLSAPERRKSIVLFSIKLIKTIILWTGLYFIASYLNINTDAWFDSTLFIGISIVVGEVLRFILLLQEREIQRK